MNMNAQEMNMINKPVMLLREEFVVNLSNLINESGLPLFVIEPILEEVLGTIKVELKKQYEYEKMQYEQALMAAAKAEGEQDDRRKISEEITENSVQE
jgi:hypothetical protein